MNAAERLIEHALAVEWYDLSASAQASARAFLFDTICVGIAGRLAPLADTVLALARTWAVRRSRPPDSPAKRALRSLRQRIPNPRAGI